MTVLAGVLKLSRALYLLLGALTYILGAGIARYLGQEIDVRLFFVGWVIAELAIICMQLLEAAFDPQLRQVLPMGSETQLKETRLAALYVGIAALAAIAVTAFAGDRGRVLPVHVMVRLGLMIGVVILFAVPPLRLAARGYGELLLAVQITYLIPSLGFALQVGAQHLLLTICAVALSCLFMASLLALEFSTYGSDLNTGRVTILIRLGWERTLPLHNGLLAATYLLLASAVLLGFSFGLVAVGFLAMPFAVLQLLLLRHIAMGGKPIWRLVNANAVAVFGLTAYLLTLSFWLR